jgi:AcrR family transcriptional regulator
MDNRSALLDAALHLFASRGYDAVGVQEIVDAVGVTKPTLYHYFGSKQGLLEELLKAYEQRLNTGLAGAADYAGDLTLTLTRLAQAYFRFARENPVYYRMLLSMVFAPMESEAFQLVNERNTAWQRRIETLFSQAARDHGNMKGRQQPYAASFLGLLNTYIILCLNGQTELNDELVYRVVHQFEHGIYS